MFGNFVQKMHQGMSITEPIYNKKGGGGTTSTIQKADPWINAQPYLINDIFPRAQGWMESSLPQYFPYSTVAAQSPETIQAMTLMKQRALMGSPLERSAQSQNLGTVQGNYLYANPAYDYLGGAASGAYLNSNPTLDAMFARASRPVTEQFQNTVLPGIASQFSAAGRYGSGAQEQALTSAAGSYGRTLADMAANIYGGNYALERQLQDKAAGAMGDIFNKERFFQEQATSQAPALAGVDWNNLQQLATVGAAREGYSQSQIEDLINRWNFAQNAPLEKLKEYNAIITGGANLGGTTQSTMPGSKSNPLLGALGGAATGYAAGGALGGAAAGSMAGPYGALIGAVLGGLLS